MGDYLLDTLVQSKRLGTLLNEVFDLSQQLGGAIDRQDQVSVEMLVAMRQEPIEKLLDTDQALRDLIVAPQDPEKAVRLSALLNGAPPQSKEEQALADQVASNARRLKQVQELDRIINLKLGKEKSIYQ